MKNALDEVNAAYGAKSPAKIVVSYAASSALMKQIEQGAPADVFISADLEWMDYGSQKKLIKDDTRVNLLGNKLVLIAPKDSKLADVTIGPGFDLAKLAGDGRIATGDVRAVPVGRYAKAALEKLGAWNAAEPKLAMAENVRAALALVGRGEAPLGIVYETDAKVEPNVKIIGVFPDGFASADHLSVRLDRDREAGRRAISVVPALASRQGDFRKIRIFIFDPSDVLEDCSCSISHLTNGLRCGCRCASRRSQRWSRCRSASRWRGCWRGRISGANRCSTAWCICPWCCRRS